MIAKVTKLEYIKNSIPPLAITFECSLFETESNPTGEHTNLFPPEALRDRIQIYDLEHEVHAVEAIIQETCSRHGEDDITVDWNHVNTSLLRKYLTKPVAPFKDFNYLYFG